MNLDFPIHHVIVVGFHHKKGCQVEYAFPPLEIELENSAWKHLPTLAIPDGAHNYQRDTVYFHLPSLKNPNETVFGVSCYQQIQSDKLINRPDDVTRSTVQKSVCVLSKYPLFGHIQVKMELITAAYFREGDFDQVSILEEAFHNLNACLTSDLLNTPEAFVALSPRDLIFQFRHQVLILFKLLLLEKKVLFHGASVGPLCSALLTLVSLVPLTLEYGLHRSACAKTSKAFSIVPQFSKDDDVEINENLDVIDTSSKLENSASTNYLNRKQVSASRNSIKAEHDNLCANKTIEDEEDSEQKRQKESTNSNFVDDASETQTRSLQGSPNPPEKTSSRVVSSSNSKTSLLSTHEEDEANRIENVPDFFTAVQMTSSDAGLPLSLFTKGYLCYPYLSLHYLDLLTDSRVRGFVVGATNVLFKQKKNLVDVIVEMQDGTIDIIDANLKRSLTLTTPDLRFAESIVKQVTTDKKSDGDSFMDGVGWEGGDEWIRAQFKYYLMCLMRTSLLENESSRVQDSFSVLYINEWKNTNNWRVWNDYVNSDQRNTPGIYSIAPGHPCEGNMSVNDMKIRLTHTMQNTEGGRRINQAVTNTGKAVIQTSKAVGGALTSAKGALSSWWSTMTTPPSIPVGQEVRIHETEMTSPSPNTTDDINESRMDN